METILKSAVLIAAFYFLYILLLQRQCTYRQQRLFLLISAIAAVLIPFVVGILPTYQMANTIYIAEINVSNNSTIQKISSQSNFLALVKTAYFIGFFFFLFYYTFQISKILWLKKYVSEKIKNYSVVLIRRDIAPFSFINKVYLPENLEKITEKNVIVQHELAHLKLLHSVDVILVTIIAIFQWFNPIAWYYLKSVKAVHEFEADAATIGSGVSVSDYCQQIISQSFNCQVQVLVNNFNKSLTLKRLAMLTQKNSRKYAKLTVFSAFVILIVSVLTVSVVRCSNKKVVQNDVNKEVSNEKNGNAIDGYIIVDENASFKGGDINDFRIFISKQLVYPEKAIKNKVTGKVILQFMVSSLGKVEKIKVLRSSGNEELDYAATDALTKSPEWTPAKIKGNNVPQLFVIPVNFSLK